MDFGVLAMTAAARQVYCFADRVFFETPDRWQRGDAPLRVATRSAPPGWVRTPKGFWTHLRPAGAVLPDQGWKVHVSARWQDVDAACDAVWDYCVREGVAFKHLASAETYLAVNSKYAPRPASGKLLTLYPVDEARLHRVLLDLERELADVRGPDVLSDLRWGASPLHVRYGAFVEAHCLDSSGEFVPALRGPDGELVPDRRRPFFEVPGWVAKPEFLANSPQFSKKSFPYRVSKALHFSNGGGVYLAERLSDGRGVVLKEARALTGLDRGRTDAATRLEREHRALVLLDGVPGVPACHGVVSAGGSDFLVVDHVEGVNLWVWMAKNHPMILFDEPDEATCRDYAERALELMDRVEAVLADVHARGLGFGDLHFGNVLVRPDGGISLVDFEMAHDLSDPDYTPDMGTMGFIAGKGARGARIDEYALAALRCALLFPLEKMRVFDPAKLEQQLAVIAERLGVAPERLDGVRATLSDPVLRPETPPELGSLPLEVDLDVAEPDWAEAIRSMRRAVLACATPERADRLFPGDSAQFRTGGATNLAHGASGVLWALAQTGHRSPEHEQWLLDAVRRGGDHPPGFCTGAHGVAHVLDHLGHHDAATPLLERATARTGELTAIGLATGLAGAGLNLLHFARSRDDRALRRAALLAADRLADALERTESTPDKAPTGGELKAGLMHGWSATALLFLRLHEDTGDPAHLDLARRALHRDLDKCVRTASGALQVEERGVRTLAYLDVGSAGIALVADELLAACHDERVERALPALLTACGSEFVLQPQLFTGRAGLITALERNRRRDPSLGGAHLVQRHLRRLAWHAVPYQGHLAFPGDFGLRLSTDLATGVAGVLVAVAATTTGACAPLPFLSPRPLPEAGASGGARSRAAATATA
ncbi:serine/threonine protein kinase [Actinosynnema pretiosum subsp. pretiosum]|nr:serine/threonine protein kinase [Actinosynnema pretiosum subsp. pretiosum]